MTNQNVVGQLLDYRYQVVKVLGAGGFGQTYIAQDIRRPGSPTCVVKQLKPASSDTKILEVARRLFKNEGETLQSLDNHAQIPRLLAYFEENKEFYLVQEFIKGHTLSAELIPNQCWTETQVTQLLQDVLGILEFIHGHGVIHRDIKPDNIIRRQQDNKLVLVDFGAVKQVRTQLVTVQGQPTASVAVGTPGYMPTEQGQGKPRPNSDIYALGIICIQALTGMSPMQLQKLEDAGTGELIWQHLVHSSSGLVSVLTKMVCYHFKDRYQSATETLQALQQACSGYYTPTQYSPPQQPSGTNVQLLKPPTQLPPISKQNSISNSPNNYLESSAGSTPSQTSNNSFPSQWQLIAGGAIAAVVIAVGLTWAITQLPKPNPTITPIPSVSPPLDSNPINQGETNKPTTPPNSGLQRSDKSTPSTPSSGLQRSNKSTPSTPSSGLQRSNKSTPSTPSSGLQRSDKSTPSTPSSGVQRSDKSTPSTTTAPDWEDPNSSATTTAPDWEDPNSSATTTDPDWEDPNSSATTTAPDWEDPDSSATTTDPDWEDPDSSATTTDPQEESSNSDGENINPDGENIDPNSASADPI